MKAIIFILALTAVFCEELEFESHINMEGITNGFNIANMITDTWKNVASALKTTKSKVYKETIKGEGFKRISLSCMSQASIGVRDLEKISRSVLTRKVKLPDEKAEVLKATFEESQYVDKNAWYGFDFVFSAGSTDNDKANFANILVNYVEEVDKHDVLFSYCNGGFKLAPDVMIFTKGLSVAGGIYEKTEDVLEEVPKSITKEDIEAIMNSFFLMGMKKLAQMLGMNTSSLVFPS